MTKKDKQTEEVMLEIRLLPRASSPRIKISAEGILHIAVTAPPIDNAANQALISLLAKILKKPKNSIQLVAGLRSRNKRIKISQANKEEVMKSLELFSGNKP
ncbi:MAG: DUF167 domain-containing protein [Candidatus Hydrogenedentes bacterium]|jgi:uncharacterized protein (TIGR00251 family)|nr:DUF167 domain-containing protein [Candidatus Hydrogenedentota bacterium]